MKSETSQTSPKDKRGDWKLEQYAYRVACLVTTLKENGSINDLSEVSAYYILVAEKLHHSYVKSYQRWLSTVGREDSFGTFADWLAEEAPCEKKAKEMTKTKEEPKQTRQRKAGRRAHATNKTSKPNNTNQTQIRCFVCGACHMLHDCAEFQSWDVQRRYGFCRAERIFFRCLSGRHRGIICRKFPGCTADGCGGSHHILLHARRQEPRQEPRAPQQDQPTQWQKMGEIKEFYPSQQSTGANRIGHSGGAPANPGASYNTATKKPETACGRIAFRTVPVMVQHGDRSVTLNALLDPCSDASFITKATANELNFDGEEQVPHLETVNGREDVKMKTGTAKLSSLHSSYESSVNVYAIPSLNGAAVRTNWDAMKKQWPHLKTIPFPRMSGKNVDVLIGLCAETTPLFVPLRTVTGAASDPVAVLTPLGWTAFGTIEESNVDAGSSDLRLRKNMTNFARTLKTHIPRKTCEEKIETIKAMTDLETIEVRNSDDSLMPCEEQAAFKMVSKSLSYDGQRYQAAVPWRNGEPRLTSNYEAAMHRLVRLEQSLKRLGGELPAKYGDILEEYIMKGYMTKIPATERTNIGGKEWFLPHFPVIREEKTSTKVRIVYDAAAKCRGVSLNSEILPGPSLYTDLVVTLLGFRLHRFH